MEQKKKPEYFEETLSDFVHDVASGRAIRHLADCGYTVEQIMQRLDFPTPRSRVEQTIFRYLKENGTLLDELPVPETQLQAVTLEHATERSLSARLSELLAADGEAQAYVSCPFGTIRRDRELRMQRLLSCLTAREREYILGIPWEMKIMYHRLDARMREISIQLAVHTDAAIRFYFLKSGKVLVAAK